MEAKKIAVVSALAGYGRCSLTVSLPVLAHLKIQGCPLPTAILSNHTGFPSFFMEDFTEQMPAYLAEWEKLSLDFDGILTGFLGSVRQIATVRAFLTRFRTAKTRVIVDPVLGDHGRPYASCDAELCAQMRTLTQEADLVTPNLTEACILTDTPYRESGFTKRELRALCEKLSEGRRRVVISGIRQGQFVANCLYEPDSEPTFLRTRHAGVERNGTGDLFAAVLAAGEVSGVPLADSVSRAARFISRCLRETAEAGVPSKNGICYELLLDRL